MLALRSRLGAQLGGFGIDFGPIWRRFGVLLAHGSDSENSEQPQVFKGFLLFWWVGVAC